MQTKNEDEKDKDGRSSFVKAFETQVGILKEQMSEESAKEQKTADMEKAESLAKEALSSLVDQTGAGEGKEKE